MAEPTSTVGQPGGGWGENRSHSIREPLGGSGFGTLDELDFKIFKAIDFRPYGENAGDISRLNPWVIVKKVGADGYKVKLRSADHPGPSLSCVQASFGGGGRARLSAKTVRRRFERMAKNNAVIIVPLVNPADIPHTITHVLLLYPAAERRKEVLDRAMEEFGRSCFLSRTAPPGNAMICLAARTLAETEENLLKARRLDGMLDAKLLVLKEIREYTQWVDSAIDRMIAETARAPIADQVSPGSRA